MEHTQLPETSAFHGAEHTGAEGMEFALTDFNPLIEVQILFIENGKNKVPKLIP